jgi:hypothetical protein
MEISISWSCIIQVAKECGLLRKEGKFEEADALQRSLESQVRLCDSVLLGIRCGEL